MGWWWWVDSGVCGVDEEFARSFGGVVRVALRCVALRCIAWSGEICAWCLCLCLCSKDDTKPNTEKEVKKGKKES